MGNCDMCGKESFLLKAMIEGTELEVCKQCARYGKVIGKVRAPRTKTRRAIRQAEPEKMEIVVPNYAKLIKEAREKRNLKQEDVAKKLSEKESIIHKIESGGFKPSIALAKKIGRFFNLDLIELYEDESDFKPSFSSSTLTIGDKIKIRKR